MPWNENSNGGGPWGGGQGGGQGPWGQPPRGGGRGPQQQPPDLEDLVRALQRGLSGLFGGGGGRGAGGAGGTGGFAILTVLALAIIGWIVWPGSGWYIAQTEEVGVVLRFGAYHRTEQPGFHLKLPVPIESVRKPAVTRVHEVNVGFNSRGDVPDESQMLTGDENIIDIDFTVFWQIKDEKAYLFNVRNPEGTVKAAAESAMREIVGKTALDPILSEGRAIVEITARELTQAMLDDYEAGIFVSQIQLQKADPPGRVLDAFRDVVNAGQDAENVVNQATQYRNDVVPKARGEAARINAEAEGYRQAVVAEATGEAERFRLIYEEYKLAPEVTRERMFLETMERVLDRSDKIIIDENAGGGVVPYLPLNELNKRTTSSSGAGGRN